MLKSKIIIKVVDISVDDAVIQRPEGLEPQPVDVEQVDIEPQHVDIEQVDIEPPQVIETVIQPPIQIKEAPIEK